MTTTRSNPDANMAVHTLDGVMKDNFQKFNRLFGDGFTGVQVGTINTTLVSLTAAAINVAVIYQRVGHQITIQFGNTYSGTKSGTTSPSLASALPVFLRPTASLYLPTPIESNGTVIPGALLLTPAGLTSWAPLSTAWTAAAAAAILPTTFTYLGN